MMNSAMDRWGIASSSVYQNHIRNIEDKENRTERKSSDSAKDDSRKNRKPLSQKKLEQEPPRSLEDMYKPKKAIRKNKKSIDSKSYSDSSSGGKGTRRRSVPVLELLGSDDDEDSKEDLPPLVVHSVEEMNEVSTIAGDTFVGVEMDAAVAEAVPPSPFDSAYGARPIPLPPGAHHTMENGMVTPTYSVIRNTKKTFSRIFSPEANLHADEESTMPESPENNDNEYENVEKGTRNQKKKLPNADKSFDRDLDSDENEFDDENKSTYSQHKQMSSRRLQLRCIMCSACFLAVFLLVGIAALGYTLYSIRHEDEGALSLFSREFWDKLAFWKKNDELTDDFYDGFIGTLAPSNTYTVWSSTSTYVPTSTETNMPVPRAMEKIRSLVVSEILGRELDDIDRAALSNPASIQYSVIEWLSSDSKFSSYSDEKILQRYAMGCFYKGLLGNETSNTTNTMDADNFHIVRHNWMGENDECQWAFTETKANQDLCNEEGQIRSLHLEDAGFTGTLSPELAFLSNSLESIFLTNNEIEGTIPSAFGQLTRLTRLQMSRNKLEGIVNGPELLAPLEKLEIIGLGGNKLNGSIPEELGTMPRMIYINIPYNDFTGSIPSTWNTTRLKHVNFAFNELTGAIPKELTGIETLNNLVLEGNDIVADVSSSVCVGETNNATTYNGMTMTVDCESVHCNCCGCEGVTPSKPVPEKEIVTAVLDGQTFPVVSNKVFDTAMEVLNGAMPGNEASEQYGCQTLEVGFQCYTSGWSIDFELSSSDCGTRQDPSPPSTTDYDLVALFPFEGDVTGPSNIGTLKLLKDSMFWATSCGLVDCDGVIANGQVYYRNTYPTMMSPLSPPWWPIAPNSMMQLQWIRVDGSGTAIVLAESQPFLVSDRCR